MSNSIVLKENTYCANLRESRERERKKKPPNPRN